MGKHVKHSVYRGFSGPTPCSSTFQQCRSVGPAAFTDWSFPHFVILKNRTLACLWMKEIKKNSVFRQKFLQGTLFLEIKFSAINYSSGGFAKYRKCLLFPSYFWQQWQILRKEKAHGKWNDDLSKSIHERGGVGEGSSSTPHLS